MREPEVGKKDYWGTPLVWDGFPFFVRLFVYKRKVSEDAVARGFNHAVKFRIAGWVRPSSFVDYGRTLKSNYLIEVHVSPLEAREALEALYLSTHLLTETLLENGWGEFLNKKVNHSTEYEGNELSAKLRKLDYGTGG